MSPNYSRRPPVRSAPARRIRRLVAVVAVALATCLPALAAEKAPSNEANGYFEGRRIAIDAGIGMGMLTDSSYEPIDYYPGYGVSIDYYLPAVVALGFEFQQIQKNGDITIPTTNLGNLEGSGRMMLSAISFQTKFYTPRFGGHCRFFLDAGIGTYIINLDTQTQVSVEYDGRDLDFDYDLNYTIVENGVNGGLGFEAVVFRRLKIGIGARIHYILEQEKDTDFGAMNAFLRIGYTR